MFMFDFKNSHEELKREYYDALAQCLNWIGVDIDEDVKVLGAFNTDFRSWNFVILSWVGYVYFFRVWKGLIWDDDMTHIIYTEWNISLDKKIDIDIWLDSKRDEE